MAKFIKVGNRCYVNLDQIISIEFDPEAKTHYHDRPCISLTIFTSDGKYYCFSDKEHDVKNIKQILEDIRYHIELIDQPPSFWDLTNDIDNWLKERGEIE